MMLVGEPISVAIDSVLAATNSLSSSRRAFLIPALMQIEMMTGVITSVTTSLVVSRVRTEDRMYR